VALLILLAPSEGFAAPAGECLGDCNGDRVVSVDELVLGVAIGIEREEVGRCRAFDSDDDLRVAVGELVGGVGNALRGCTPAAPTHTATPTASETVTATREPSATLTPSATPSEPPLETPTPTATGTAAATATETGSTTATPTATITSTATPTSVPTATATPTASIEISPSPTETPSAGPTPTETDTTTATPSSTPTASPSPTSTHSTAPTPTTTESPTPTASAHASSSPTPTPTRTLGATHTDTATATPAATSTFTPSPTRTSTPTGTSTATGTPTQTPSVTLTRTATPTTALTNTNTRTSTATPTSTRTSSPTSSPTRTPTSTPTPSPTVTRTPTTTATWTPTTTASPTPTRTPAPGVRRFSLDSGASSFAIVPGGSVPGFQGYLDLQMGPLDASGIAKVSVVGSSPFLSLELGGGAMLCLRPLVPAADAGVIDCDGGTNLGVKTTQDHNIGQVGVGGFTAGSCSAAQGSVESAGQPHPNVCNGPIVTSGADLSDSGMGALLIAPNPQFGTNGLPVEFSMQQGFCAPGAPAEVFAFTTASYRAEIADAGNASGMLLMHEEQGQNFDCAAFTQENGPGRLVFSLGTLHGGGTSDLILVFVLAD
jgi:hypothetical protein